MDALAQVDVCGSAEAVPEIVSRADEIDDREARIGRDVEQDVDVARLVRLAAGDGAEHGDGRDPARPQGIAVRLEEASDVVDRHETDGGARAPKRKRGPMGPRSSFT